MYHKLLNKYHIIIYLLFICKFELINCNLIKKLFMPKNIQSRSSKMNSREFINSMNKSLLFNFKPIRTFDSLDYLPSVNSLSINSDLSTTLPINSDLSTTLPITYHNLPSINSLSSINSLPTSTSFLFSDSLPKNIPLKVNRKKSISNKKSTNQINKIRKSSYRTTKSSNRSTKFKHPPIQKFTKPITPLPIDSPLIFNTSLIKNKPIISSPNTPLASTNFYYLIDEDKPNYFLNEKQLTNYLNQECLKFNDLNNNIQYIPLSNDEIEIKKLDRIDFLNLKSIRTPSTKKLNKKKLNKKPIKKVSSISKRRKNTIPKKKAGPKKVISKKVGPKKVVPKKVVPKYVLPVVYQSSPINNKNSIINIPNNIIYDYPNESNLFNYQSNQISFPIYSKKTNNPIKKSKKPIKTKSRPLKSELNFRSKPSITQFRSNSIKLMPIKSEFAKHNKIKPKKPIKKKNRKKPNQMLNSSSNDKIVIAKYPKNTKSKLNKNSIKNKKKSINNKNSINKLSSSSSTKSNVDHIYKNAIYVNQKETEKEMLDAFHQSTLEEDLNIIKEILKDYDKLSKDPLINQYYANSDYKLDDNKNQILNDNNYIIFDHNHLADKPKYSKYPKEHLMIEEQSSKKYTKKDKSKDKKKYFNKNNGRKYPWFGFPIPNIHSNDFFDQETTYDEKMFEKNYPYRYGVNPGIRDLIKKIFFFEAKFEKLKNQYNLPSTKFLF